MTPAIEQLVAARIDHEVCPYDHDPRSASYGLEAAESLGLDPSVVFKTLMVEWSGALGVCVVPVDHQLSLKAAAKALGAKKVVMASVQSAERATGYLTGGISPLGQRRAHPTVVDDSALPHPRIWVSGGKRGLDVGLAPSDLVSLTKAAVAPIRA